MAGRIMLEHDWFPEPLPANVEIGERCWIYSAFAFRHYRSERPCGVHIGADCGVYPGTFFNLGPDGEVRIGDHSSLVGAIIHTNQRIDIGRFVFVGHEVVLADAYCPEPGVFVEPSAGRASIVLEDDCWIGARAVILGGTHIGAGSIVGAAAVVEADVPPLTIVAGNPARVVGRVRTGSTG